MKTISNEKRLSDGLGGIIYYHMRRSVGGQRFGMDLAVTRYEYEHGRQVVALRLRRAREQLRRIAQLTLAFQAADRNAAERSARHA